VDPTSERRGAPTLVELTRYRCFEASHRYWRADWSAAENLARFGRCTSPFGHGHNYTIAVTVRGAIDPATGMVVNLSQLDELIAGLTATLDHQFINQAVPAFHEGTQPTAEALARYSCHRLSAALRAGVPRAGAEVCFVAMHEGDTLQGWCARPDAGLARADEEVPVLETIGLTRTYSFSAAHRLHEPRLSDAENQARFGKCNNRYGHGHDYRLDVTVSGPLDPKTSMVVDLASLDEAVQSVVLARLDHRHLNHEVPPFDRLNPTSENVLQVIWEWLEPVCPARLVEIALSETPRNRFTLRRKESP
jgi:6-pyruvoyltetrahydropterin/6-carboxytetrahydropterin synthase